MGRMEHRAPMDTVTEFAPYEDATGNMLDLFGEPHGVKRLEGEDDVSFRDRIRDAIRVKNKSERAKRGESLIPAGSMSDDSIPPSLLPKGIEVVEMQAEAHYLLERNRSLEEMNRQQRDTLLHLRAVLKDVSIGAKVGSWDAVNRALTRLEDA